MSEAGQVETAADAMAWANSAADASLEALRGDDQGAYFESHKVQVAYLELWTHLLWGGRIH